MSDSVLLRDVAPDDLPELFRHQQDPAAARMAAFPARDREAFDAHWTRILADDALHKKTVLVDGRVAGYVAAFPLEGKLHVGYWFGREFWGRGIATRALAAFLEELRTRPVYARVARHNAASRRVLQKCGFAVVGEDATAADGVDEIILILTDRVAHQGEPTVKRLPFWSLWLTVVALTMAAFGILMVLSGPGGLLNGLTASVDSAFWPASPIPDSLTEFRRWLYGVWGATVAGFGLLAAFLAGNAYLRRERWARDALAWSLAIWYVLDTGVSIRAGVWINAAFNTVVLAAFVLGLIFTWRDFPKADR
jgi:RimJ/RimL family protein N-acetyltransferase